MTSGPTPSVFQPPNGDLRPVLPQEDEAHVAEAVYDLLVPGGALALIVRPKAG